MGEKSSIAHGVTTKFLPFFFILISFLYISDFTRESILIISPEDMFVSISIYAAGLVLLYEGANHWPKRHSTFGAGGATFMFIFAATNFIFGTFIITDVYQWQTDSGDINLILQIVLGISVLTILIQGIYEVRTSRRLLADRVFA